MSYYRWKPVKARSQIAGKRKWILYAGYAVCAGLFFFYLLFPSAPIKAYLDGKLKRLAPAYTFTVNTIKPALPLGLRLRGTTFLRMGTPVFDARSITLYPRPLSLFGTTPAATFHMDAYDGNIEGRVRVVQNPPGPRVSMDATLSEVQIRDLPLAKKITPHTLLGKLSGTLHSGAAGNGTGTLAAKLHISDFDILFLKPFLAVESLHFGRIDADIGVHREDVEIEHADIRGREMDGTLAGVIRFKRPSGESLLDLEGTLTPHPELFEGREGTFLAVFFSKARSQETVFAFNIGGTLDNPVFSLK